MEGSVNMDIEREDHEEKEIRERRGWEDVNCCSPSSLPLITQPCIFANYSRHRTVSSKHSLVLRPQSKLIALVVLLAKAWR